MGAQVLPPAQEALHCYQLAQLESKKSNCPVLNVTDRFVQSPSKFTFKGLASFPRLSMSSSPDGHVK